MRQPESCKGGKPWPPAHLKGQRVGVLIPEPGVSCNLGQKSDGALIYSRGVRGSQLLPKPRPTVCVCVCVCVCVIVTQVCPTLCNPMDCNPPGSSVNGILQARILEWVAFSRGSSWPRDWTQVSCIVGWFFGTPWSVACQAPLYMEFSRQEYWSG